MCGNTGWTWTYVREHIDLPTLDALRAEWALHPPVHHLVAAYLGHKPSVQAPAHAVVDIEDLLPELGHVPIRHVAPLDTSAFDAALKGDPHG